MGHPSEARHRVWRARPRRPGPPPTRLIRLRRPVPRVTLAPPVDLSYGTCAKAGEKPPNGARSVGKEPGRPVRDRPTRGRPARDRPVRGGSALAMIDVTHGAARGGSGGGVRKP